MRQTPVALPSFILGFRRSSFNNTEVKR